MLPYHLRAPIFGGKLKRQREDELSPDSLKNPYIGGGPYQRAIEKDLLDVRGDFQSQLSQIKSIHAKQQPSSSLKSPAVVDTESSSQHRQGQAFGVFKKVFGAAKVARLHTRLAPPRCDQTAYAQLIYAACLSLLKQSQSNSIPKHHHQPEEDANHANQEEDNDDVKLTDAAYAVFCLYALYETNPLSVPHGPTDDGNKSQSRQSQLAMLSMGLQNRENPKLLFRRAFRSHIRIDQQHYAYLVTLKDLALSKIATCRANGSGKSPRSRSSSESDSDDNDSESSSRDAQPHRKCQCHCAIAEDIVEVIGRLWKHLDLCAYTGPCSAEGLAGHADYPFPVNEQAVKAKSAKILAVSSSSGVSTSTTTNSDVVVATEPWQLSEHLQERLESYLSSRQSIRLPALHANNSQQTKRVRQALEPMFRKRTQQEGIDPLARLSNTIQGGGAAVEAAAKPRTLRRVTFGSIMVGGDASVVSSKRNMGETDAGQEDSLARGAGAAEAETDAEAQEESTPSYQLILPDEMPFALQESIQTAVETLMDQGETLLGFSEPAHVSDSIHGGDVSTLGAGGVSTASSTTGVGRNALQTLLSQVDNGGDASTVTGRGRDALQNLLALAREEDTDSANDRNVLQDLLSQAGSEGASSATGTGRNALQDLLAQARNGDTGTATGSNSLQDLPQAGDEDASTATGTGRNALQDLLAQARNGDTDTATGRKSLQDLLPQTGDEDGSKNSGVGRNALRDLLSQASIENSQKPAPRRKQADLFLDTEQDDTKARAGRASVSSDVDVSDVSSDDEVASVALSCVGKRALDDLLSAGNRKRATTSSKRKVAARQVRRSRKKRAPPNSAIDSIADESEDDDEDALSAKSECVARGKSALDDLLKLGMGRNE